MYVRRERPTDASEIDAVLSGAFQTAGQTEVPAEVELVRDLRASPAWIPLVCLLGDPAYYQRFGFVAAARHRIEPPVDAWSEHFQVRVLTRYEDSYCGRFRYPDPVGAE